MGLLDFNFDDPAMRQGLLSAGAAMMKASGNRRVPVSFIEGLGEGLDQGMQGYYDADTMQRKKMQDDYENQQEMLKRQDQEAQRAALMAYAKSKNKMPQKQAQAAPRVQGFSMPNQQMQNDRVNGNFAGAPMQSSIPKGMPQQNQQAPQMTKGSLVQSQIAELMSQAQFYGSREDYQSQAMAQQLQKQAIELAKELPKYANDFRVAKDKNGNVVNLRMADDGSMMQSDYGVAEKMHFADIGGQLAGFDPYSGNSKILANKTMSPADKAAAFRADRAYNQSERQFAGTQDLKRQEIGVKQAEKIEAKNQAASNQVSSIDTMLDSLDRLKMHPGLKNSVGFMSVAPTMPGSDSANFQAELDTFQSQAFIPMVSQLKGMGALSDAEGKKLTAAVGALNPRMSEKAFKESLTRIKTDIEAARQRAIQGTTLPERKSDIQGAVNQPMKGQVMDGYKYKGGDPADPNSWEKM